MRLGRETLGLGYICSKCSKNLNCLIAYRSPRALTDTHRVGFRISSQSNYLKRNFFSTSGAKAKEKLNIDSLETRYNEILNYLVQRNLSIINQFILKCTSSNQSSKCYLNKVNTSFNQLHSIIDDSFSASNSIKQLGKLINSNYHEIIQSRKRINRYPASLAEYNWFLTLLYPKGGKIQYSKLYDSYNSLPTPRPLHISPDHLEAFISAFMGPINNTEATRAIFGHILNDLESAGMPISHHELNAAMGMAIRGYYEESAFLNRKLKFKNPSINRTPFKRLSEVVDDMESQQISHTDFSTMDLSLYSTPIPPSLDSLMKIRNKVSSSHPLDISAINTLYGFALKTNDDKLAKEISQPLRSGNVEPDRITFLIEMIQAGSSGNGGEIRQLYQEMCNRRYTIDIVVMNVMMKALLASGDLEGAEIIFNAIIEQNERIKQNSEANQFSDSMNGIQSENRTRVSDNILFDINGVEDLESFGPMIPSESLHLNQLKLIDFIQQIIRNETQNSNEPIDHNENNIQDMVPLNPDKYTFGTLFGYYCIKSGDANKALDMIPMMTKYGVEITEFHFLMLYKGFISHTEKISQSNKYSVKHSSEWNKTLLNNVTTQLYRKYSDLFHPSLSRSSYVKIVNSQQNPFTRRLCSNMIKAYSVVYWDKQVDISQIENEYRQALSPARQDSVNSENDSKEEDTTNSETTNSVGLDSRNIDSPYGKADNSKARGTITSGSPHATHSITYIVFETVGKLLSLSK